LTASYVFGPIGQAALLTNCKYITDDVFTVAANALAALVPESTLESGMLFPSISQMKTLVVPLIARIAEHIVSSDLGTKPEGVTSWEAYIKTQMYNPKIHGRQLSVKVASTPVPEVHHEDMQELVMLRHMSSDIQRYLFLRYMQDTQPETFWKLMINNAQELLPFVYTPTVGEACEHYSNLPIKTRGLYIRQEDAGHIMEKLKAWKHQEIEVIVVTDGERILGLGDLGAGGMGISEGKIILYTVMGGVDPSKCLPVCLDVGTNNPRLLEDPEYAGLSEKRLRGETYDALVEEFITALKQWQPNVLLQFEDFGNTNAFRLLEKYQEKILSFNDDIQGTACITLAGVLSALRVTGRPLKEQKIIFMGAGEAGTGIGKLIALCLVDKYGIPLEEALKSCFYIDSKGLVCKSRTDLQEHKLPFAHDVPYEPNLLAAVKALKPSVLIGVSTITGAFSKEVLEVMHENNERPVIFPLSNPTSKAECTFEEAYHYTGGNVVFASGSPFPPYTTNDERTLYPAQANNAYIFGPIGKAAVLTKCKAITDQVFLRTAEILAEKTPGSRLASGMLFPAFSDMKEVAPQLIAGISEFMVKAGLGEEPKEVASLGWLKYVVGQMYTPPN
jgi:malate dehydrogenase (oxaloacetate-decarboxylating)(NADP+)